MSQNANSYKMCGIEEANRPKYKEKYKHILQSSRERERYVHRKSYRKSHDDRRVNVFRFHELALSVKVPFILFLFLRCFSLYSFDGIAFSFPQFFCHFPIPYKIENALIGWIGFVCITKCAFYMQYVPPIIPIAPRSQIICI